MIVLMQKQYLSKESFGAVKKELEELKTNKRAEIAQRLKVAKEYGDLSENSEYSEAREEQANVEGRIFELEELLKNAEIVAKQAGGDTVQVGATIVVKKGRRPRLIRSSVRTRRSLGKVRYPTSRRLVRRS